MRRALPARAHAAISGRVLGADGTTPLRRAIVRLSSSALPRRLTVRTDLQGRYTFPDLPPDAIRYLRPSPVTSRWSTGQRRPFEAGRRIELGAAERLTGVDIVLPPSASITGVVIDDAGERVNQMWVTGGASGLSKRTPDAGYRGEYRHERHRRVPAFGARARRLLHRDARARRTGPRASPTSRSDTGPRCIPGSRRWRPPNRYSDASDSR